MTKHMPTEGIDEHRYRIKRVIGRGSYGTVAEAFDENLEGYVAMKRIALPEQNQDAVSMAREIRLLHALRSDNIISLLDVVMTERSLYIISELCDVDLLHVIQSDSRHNLLMVYPNYMLSIMYQILHALDFIHGEGVFHRDIKPTNILVDCHLNVKLCDFGMARLVDKQSCNAILDHNQNNLTCQVVSLWYRAPCVTLCKGRYGKAQDIWAAGCTFAEMITREPLFPGTTDLNQLQVIVDVLGKLSDENLDFEMSERGRRFIVSLDSKEIGLESSLLPGVNEVHPDLLELLKNMLRFNPHHRITSTQACQLPLFSHFHRFDHEPTSPSTSALIKLAEDMHRIDECISSGEDAISFLRQEVEDIRYELSALPKRAIKLDTTIKGEEEDQDNISSLLTSRKSSNKQINNINKEDIDINTSTSTTPIITTANAITSDNNQDNQYSSSIFDILPTKAYIKGILPSRSRRRRSSSSIVDTSIIHNTTNTNTNTENENDGIAFEKTNEIYSEKPLLRLHQQGHQRRLSISSPLRDLFNMTMFNSKRITPVTSLRIHIENEDSEQRQKQQAAASTNDNDVNKIINSPIVNVPQINMSIEMKNKYRTRENTISYDSFSTTEGFYALDSHRSQITSVTNESLKIDDSGTGSNFICKILRKCPQFRQDENNDSTIVQLQHQHQLQPQDGKDSNRMRNTSMTIVSSDGTSLRKMLPVRSIYVDELNPYKTRT
eukprot:gene2164-4212_t